MKIPALTKTYGSRTVLNTPELELKPDTVYSLIGPNGSGKSTFAKIAAGLLAPDGRPPLSDKDTVIRYMPQKSYPFRMSIEKNIMLAGDDPQRAAELMNALGLTEISRQKITTLSGGETAKIALIRVLMKPCSVLILDEPTSAMDMESAIISEKLIGEYRKECGCTVLFVTHDLFQARRMSDEALFFNKGILEEYGPASALLYRPEKEITARFLQYYGSVS